MPEVLDRLLGAPPDVVVLSDVAAWWSHHRELSVSFAAPVDLALAAGFSADRLGWAFASGYQAAGQRLFGFRSRGVFDGDPSRPGALCATEAGGNHPRSIETTLTARDGGFVVTGDKTYVTLGTFAEVLLVVARAGTDDAGRPRLKVVAVEASAGGVDLQELPETPFVPEIPHAALALRDVAVAADQVLPGDGYAEYLKPFRTVEDVHVHAALLGYLVGVGRRSGWADRIVERLAASATAVRTLAASDPNDPTTHVALAGSTAAIAEIASDDALWARVEDTERSRWERDRTLLSVAGSARSKRLERAWERLRDG